MCWELGSTVKVLVWQTFALKHWYLCCNTLATSQNANGLHHAKLCCGSPFVDYKVEQRIFCFPSEGSEDKCWRLYRERIPLMRQMRPLSGKIQVNSSQSLPRFISDQQNLLKKWHMFITSTTLPAFPGPDWLASSIILTHLTLNTQSKCI